MTTPWRAIVAGGFLAALLIVGAGSAFAQDPTPTASSSPMTRGHAGMMGGQMGPAMMGSLSPAQIETMQSMHAAMTESGACDPSLMATNHEQLHSPR
jgi:hypothetical protein